MADFATGTWNLVETENFDEYMKAVGDIGGTGSKNKTVTMTRSRMQGVGMVMRKMGSATKPTQEISVEGGRWKIKTITTVKTTEIEFGIGEEFEETTADGRKVKTVMSLDGQKLTAVQKGEVDSTITREWSDDTMTMKLAAKDAVCTRIYKRANK